MYTRTHTRAATSTRQGQPASGFAPLTVALARAIHAVRLGNLKALRCAHPYRYAVKELTGERRINAACLDQMFAQLTEDERNAVVLFALRECGAPGFVAQLEAAAYGARWLSEALAVRN